jgi:hypothetical protein
VVLLVVTKALVALVAFFKDSLAAMITMLKLVLVTLRAPVTLRLVLVMLRAPVTLRLVLVTLKTTPVTPRLAPVML